MKKIVYGITALLLVFLVPLGCDQDIPERIDEESEAFTGSQVPEFEGTFLFNEKTADTDQSAKRSELNKSFEKYAVFKMDASSLSVLVNEARNTTFKLTLSEEYQWEITLEPSGLLSDGYKAYAVSSSGRTTEIVQKDVFYKGTTSDGGRVRFTLNGNTINGYIQYGDREIFIENIQELGIDAPENELILYSSGDVKAIEGITCAATQVGGSSTDRIMETQSNDECRLNHVLEMATVGFYDIYKHYDYKVDKTNERILTILNHTQANYDDFNIKFRVTEQRVNTCSSCDNTDALEAPHDILVVYAKDIWAGSQLGEAPINSLCYEYAYIAVEHRSLMNILRTGFAHEIGHVFGADHIDDGSKHIMNSSVRLGGTNNWHSTTKGIIKANKKRGCLNCESPIDKGWYLFPGGQGEGINVSQSNLSAGQMKVGDFDGDGKDDLFTSHSRNWYIAYGKSLHLWTKVNHSAVSLSDIAIGDFNGDGKDDVFTQGVQGKKGWFVSYGATGSWVKIGKSGTTVSEIRLGDFNGDGRTDVMKDWDKFTHGEGWYVCYSSVNGTSDWTKVNGSGRSMREVLIGDFDADGIDDVFTYWGNSMGDGAGWYVAYGGAGHGYDHWHKLNGPLRQMDALKIGDFNGDGKSDALTRFAQGAGEGIGWYTSYSGTQGWHKLRDNFNVSGGLERLLIGDFDGDGKTDILYTHG